MADIILSVKWFMYGNVSVTRMGLQYVSRRRFYPLFQSYTFRARVFVMEFLFAFHDCSRLFGSSLMPLLPPQYVRTDLSRCPIKSNVRVIS
jgi:hypothetical protein